MLECIRSLDGLPGLANYNTKLDLVVEALAVVRALEANVKQRNECTINMHMGTL